MYSINSDFNKIFKAIGYKTRTDILKEICNVNYMTLSKLAKKFNMSKQTLDFHIKELKTAGIINSKRKDGTVRLIFNRKEIDKAINIFQTIIS